MNSRPVRSNQPGVHPNLDAVVRRHLESEWRKPPGPASRAAFEGLRARIGDPSALVLDSGCGTGASTARLAGLHPESVVVGVDRSAARLARAPRDLPGNAHLVRARLEDFWRLALAAGWRPSHHYLLYPNPWPKAAQLRRRWHAHPAFPTLLALGGRLELCSNWEIYVREFARSLRLAGIEGFEMVSFRPGEAISPFEKKYAESGHKLFRLTAKLETRT